MYKLILDRDNVVRNVLLINGDNEKYIPFNENNTDYQTYLKWLEEGNEPLPADE